MRRAALIREPAVNEIRPEGVALPLRVEARAFQDDMAEYLRRARQGASFLIVSDGEVVAELRPPPEPPAPKPPRRLAGAMRGKIWMADDFDTWPEGFIEAMVDGPIFPDEDKGG